MRVSVALGSTARAACRACLRRSVAFGHVGEALLQPLEQLGVGGERGVGRGEEALVQVGVLGDHGRLDERGVPLGHVALGELAVGEVPVPDQLVASSDRETPVRYMVTVPCSSTERWPTSRMCRR